MSWTVSPHRHSAHGMGARRAARPTHGRRPGSRTKLKDECPIQGEADASRKRKESATKHGLA
eukprot:4114014-Pyramimonas_sp.AAC.1